MGSEKKPRLATAMPGQKSAKSSRLWLIPPLALFIYVCSKTFSPASSHFARRDLQSHNYFATSENQTLSQLPNPFPFCPPAGPHDALAAKYGASNLARTRIHVGSGVRLQRVIKRAMSGLPVTISVLGGSVAACHGAGDDPIAPKCWPARFFDWWNDVFPHPASELTNGAMRKTDSSYYAFCHSHHIPDRTDLIIVDFSITETRERADGTFPSHLELLLRALLIRRDQPAVILLGNFVPQFQDGYGYTGPELGQVTLAPFYDVPYISTKPLLYPSYVLFPDSVSPLYTDPMLANSHGHEVIADTLAAFVQSQACSVWSSVISGVTQDSFAGIGVLGAAARKPDGKHTDREPNYPMINQLLDTRPPPYLTTTRHHEMASFRDIEPFCASANDLVNPLPPSLFSGTGWHVYHPAGSHSTDSHDGSENAHYWYSTIPTSRLKIPVKLGAGDVGVYYMQEPRSDEGNSAISCWVDDNYGGAVEIRNGADIDVPRPALKIIDKSVAKGTHNVECALAGEEGTGVEPFRIVGIFAT